MTNVIRERENVDQNCLPKRANLILNSKVENEVLRFPKNNLMLTIKKPFRPLNVELNAGQLIEEYWLDQTRPLKLLFRFVESL